MIALFGRCEAGHAFPVKNVTTTFLSQILTVDQVRAAGEDFLRSVNDEEWSGSLCGGAVEFVMIERDKATA